MSKKKKTPYFPPPELPCTGVETHAHLDSSQFVEDLDDVIQRAKQAGVQQIGQVFLHPEKWEKTKDIFLAHPDFFFLLGIHPTDSHEVDETVLDAIASILANEPRIKAVGEIGLDYYWKECPPERQKLFFRKQLALAKELNKPVVIHSRDAEEETIALLQEEGFSGRPLLWHCFGGAIPMAKKILDSGWHISIPGPVTYPANQALRESVAMIPLDRIMVETDCPYLAPHPMRGKRNEPAFLGYTIAVMAEAKGMAPEELWTICGDNARRFFALP